MIDFCLIFLFSEKGFYHWLKIYLSSCVIESSCVWWCPVHLCSAVTRLPRFSNALNLRRHVCEMSLFKMFNSLILFQSEWPEFVKNYAPWWASHTLDWLKYGKQVQVVHFEDLKRELYSELKGMVILLSLEVSEDRLLCVEGQKDGNFKRSGLRKLEYDPYTPEMRASIDGLIKTVDTALRKRNLSGVPEEYKPRWYSSLHLCFFCSQHTFFPSYTHFSA